MNKELLEIDTIYFRDDWGWEYVARSDNKIYQILDKETYHIKEVIWKTFSKEELEITFEMNPLTFMDEEDFFQRCFNNSITSFDELCEKLTYLEELPKRNQSRDFGYIIERRGDVHTFTKCEELIEDDDSFYVSKHNIEHLFECVVKNNELDEIIGIDPNIILKNSQLKRYFRNIGVNYSNFINKTFLNNEGKY